MSAYSSAEKTLNQHLHGLVQDPLAVDLRSDGCGRADTPQSKVKVGSVFDMFSLPTNYPARTDPFSTSLLVATICVYFTIGQSILIGRRLRSGSLEHSKGRLSDALWFTGPMIGLVIVLQVMFYLIPMINGSVSELVPISLAYLLIVFMIGFFVPSTSHAHLEATKIILSGQTSVKPTAWGLGTGKPSRSLSLTSREGRR